MNWNTFAKCHSHLLNRIQGCSCISVVSSLESAVCVCVGNEHELLIECKPLRTPLWVSLRRVPLLYSSWWYRFVQCSFYYECHRGVLKQVCTIILMRKPTIVDYTFRKTGLYSVIVRNPLYYQSVSGSGFPAVRYVCCDVTRTFVYCGWVDKVRHCMVIGKYCILYNACCWNAA